MSSQMQNPEQSARLPWYRGISSYAWLVLMVSALGWMFDTLDQQLFTLIRYRSLEDILQETTTLNGDALKAAITAWSQSITSIFLIGFALGGFIFGILGDKLGRTRTMMITILIYATFTGLNGLVHTPELYALCRFITALGIGGEFAAGAALVAEVWPARSRPMALGFLQALSTVGNMMAAGITLALASADWRIVYFIGIIPAFLVVIIRTFVKEPEQWKNAKHSAEDTKQQLGSIKELFTNPGISRNTFAALLIALAGVLGLWGIGYFQPDMISQLMKAAGSSEKDIQTAKSLIFLIFQVGGFIGMYGYAAVSERIGRRPALVIIYVGVIVLVQSAYWTVHSVDDFYIWTFFLGMFMLSPFSAFGVYFPELFPTRLRSTGVGVCYNFARLFAAAGIFFVGKLTASFVNPDDPVYAFRLGASIMCGLYLLGFIGIALAPETKGKPLPE